MPLPNGYPDWIFPGTHVRRNTDNTEWVVVNLGTRRDGLHVEALRTGGGYEPRDFPVESFLRAFHPETSQRGAHIVPIEGAHGEYMNPLTGAIETFEIQHVGEDDVTLIFFPEEEPLIDTGIGPVEETVSLDTYRANVLAQEMPSILPGALIEDHDGEVMCVVRISFADDPGVLLQSLADPATTTSVWYHDLCRMEEASYQSVVTENMYVLAKEGEREALGLILAVRETHIDVILTGERSLVEALPRESVSFLPLCFRTLFRIAPGRSMMRAFRIGDIFSDERTGCRFAIIRVEPGTEGEWLLSVVHSADLPEDYIFDSPSLVFQGNGQEGLGYSPTTRTAVGTATSFARADHVHRVAPQVLPAEPPTTPLTRVPLVGFTSKVPFVEDRVARRSAFERLTEDDDI